MLLIHDVERFSVVSYNILGDKNAFKHRDLYQNVRYEYMKWNRRKRLICQELIGLNPDILCMQVSFFFFNLFYFIGTGIYGISIWFWTFGW